MEYTVDERANIVIFAVENDASNSIKTPSAQEAARGYRIPFEQSTHIGSSRQIFLARSAKNGNWTKPLQIGIQSPVTGRTVNNFDYQLDLRLSLSPDGRSLLFQYVVGEAIPDYWKRSPFVQTLLDRYGLAGQLTVLYDVTSGKTTVAFQSLYTLNVPLWSADSGSFLVAAYPPVGSPWWPQEPPNPVIFSDLYDLFWVRPSAGQVELVKSHLPSVQEQPLFWGRDNRVLLYSGTRLGRRAYTETTAGGLSKLRLKSPRRNLCVRRDSPPMESVSSASIRISRRLPSYSSTSEETVARGLFPN